MKSYKVKIKGFSDKVYKVDNIQDILHEVIIFTDIENIISIIEQQESESSTCLLKISSKQNTYFTQTKIDKYQII